MGLVIGTAVGCSDQSSASDGTGFEQGVADLSIHLVDAGQQGQEPGAADAVLPDQGNLADYALWDFFLVDAGLSVATVLYAVGTDPESMGLRTVGTVAGIAAPVVGWSGYLDFDPLTLSGQQEILPVSTDQPQVMKQHDPAWQGIQLPGSLGALYYFHHQLTNTSGLLQIDKSGALIPLLEVPGIYADTLSGRIGLSRDGRVGVALQGQQQVIIFRTDGVMLDNGQLSATLAMPSSHNIARVKPRSLTLADKTLFCVGTDQGGKDWLLRAPLTGSGALEPVTLSDGQGNDVAHIAEQPALSHERDYLIVAAGANATAKELYRITVAPPAVSKLLQGPGPIGEPGDDFGYLSGRLALSPAGSAVAFVHDQGNHQELFVMEANGASLPRQLSDDAHFAPEVSAIANLVLVDEKNLLFMAGITLNNVDLYRWDIQHNTLTNLTTTGAVAPFGGQGSFSPRGGWFSPNQKWLYYLLQEPQTQATSIVGINCATFAVSWITKTIQVQSSPGSLVACPSSGRVFFTARPQPAFYAAEVYSFEQNYGQVAQQHTQLAGATNSWLAQNLALSSDCAFLIWTGGPTYYQRDLWLLPTNAPAGPHPVTNNPLFFSSAFLFAPDQRSVIYSSGGAPGATTLKGVPLQGASGPTLLDSPAGYLQVLAVY